MTIRVTTPLVIETALIVAIVFVAGVYYGIERSVDDMQPAITEAQTQLERLEAELQSKMRMGIGCGDQR